MLLKKTNPQVMMTIAFACLALFGALGLPSLTANESDFTKGLVDGARGALMGATVALIYLASRARRQRGNGAQ